MHVSMETTRIFVACGPYVTLCDQAFKQIFWANFVKDNNQNGKFDTLKSCYKAALSLSLSLSLSLCWVAVDRLLRMPRRAFIFCSFLNSKTGQSQFQTSKTRKLHRPEKSVSLVWR